MQSFALQWAYSLSFSASALVLQFLLLLLVFLLPALIRAIAESYDRLHPKSTGNRRALITCVNFDSLGGVGSVNPNG